MNAAAAKENMRRRLLAWGLILAGAALRLALLGRFPPGLNQDEASAGYEAWALLRYGVDRNGCAWPVLFVSWGSGQNVLYSYLSMPFVALLGLNPLSLRLTAGLCGTLSLPLFYDAARRVRGERFALWALAALAVNPWHVLLSRWALESNLLPFCLLLALYCLVRTREDGRWLYGAAAACALALYAYGTAYLFLVFFLPAASALLWRRRAVSWRTYLFAAALFALLALPVTLCQARNALGLGSMRLFGLTLPALNETRQSTVSVFGGGGLRTAWANFGTFLKLLWTQSDGLVWNSAGPFGLLYGKAGLALAALGLARAIEDARRGRARGERYILLALLASCLASFFIDGNVNRLNMAFLPLVWLQGLGLASLAALSRPWAAGALAAALLLAAGFFTGYYFTDYAERAAPSFYAGLGEAIEDAAAREPEETIWISWDVSMPYIYVLFYEQIPPDEYRADVRFMNPGGAFEWPTGFGRWRFGREPPRDGTLCIVRADKLGDGAALASYGEWTLVRYENAPSG